MQAKSVIRIVAEVALVVLLSSCTRETPIVTIASASAAEPAVAQWPAPALNDKGDGSFRVYEYY